MNCNTNKKLCKEVDCKECYSKSFASFEGLTKNNKLIVDCWSEKNKISTREIFRSTNKKYFFNCDVCGHEILKDVCGITKKDRDKIRWCPYCSIKGGQLCENVDCEYCFNRSLASFDSLTPNGKLKIDCWHESNNINPRFIFKHASAKYKFKCDICDNIFETKINNLTDSKSLCWCPYCKNKTETKLKNYLEKKYSQYTIKHQVKFDWCKNKQCLPFDFLIEELKIIIELDGEQHFSKRSKWYEPEKNLVNDTFKSKKALENEYNLIRILQEDVWLNTNHWTKKLDDIIKNIKDIKKPAIFFIDKKDKYINHKKNMSALYIRHENFLFFCVN